MELTISYLLKSVMVLVALHLFYYLLLRKENNFSFNRLYLLAAPLVAFGLPLLKWPVALAPENAISEALQAIQLTEVTVTAYRAKKASADAGSISPALLAAFAYGLGILFILVKLAKQLWQVRTVKAAAVAASTNSDGVKVYRLPAHLPTFAFGNNIFLGNQAHLSKTDQAQVLAHELAHVKLRHTWDVLYYEILSAILWANPVIWLLKQELRDVHEYQADAKVLTSYQAQAYSSLLSKEALLNMGLPIGSYFQKPQVLKRLQMLQQHGHRSGWLRPMLALPLIGGLAFLFSAQQADAHDGVFGGLAEEVSDTASPETAKPAKTAFKPAAEQPKEQPVMARETLLPAVTKNATTTKPTTTDAEKPYMYVEEMPQFKGGETEMLKYLAKNIRYPKEAQEAGTAGLVVVSFTVGKDGALADFTVLKSLDESTDAEALRVVQSMDGSWIPGKQNGRPVPVKYTMPIRFAFK